MGKFDKLLSRLIVVIYSWFIAIRTLAVEQTNKTRNQQHGSTMLHVYRQIMAFTTKQRGVRMPLRVGASPKELVRNSQAMDMSFLTGKSPL